MRPGLLPRHLRARLAAAWATLVAALAFAFGFTPSALAAPPLDVVDAATSQPAAPEETVSSDSALFFLDAASLDMVCAPARAEAQVTAPCSDDFPQLIEVVAYCDERGASMLEAPFAAPVTDARIEAVADCQTTLGFSGPVANGERDGTPAQPPAPSLEPADVVTPLPLRFLPLVALLPDTPYASLRGVMVERGLDRPPRSARG